MLTHPWNKELIITMITDQQNDGVSNFSKSNGFLFLEKNKTDLRNHTRQPWTGALSPAGVETAQHLTQLAADLF